MLLSEATRQRLLGAIEAESLVILCGAGLSMGVPSNLPSAVAISRRCYDKRVAVEPALNPALRDDIDGLAGHFYSTKKNFQGTFIPLVPWNELVGSPNAGHAAIADFLISKAARAALSANFDALIETWAGDHKTFLLGALTGQEATDATNIAPLLKFHGCLHRERLETLWTHAQLAEPAIAQRVQTCAQWMNLLLPGKHLVVVGFWTDWGYLNDVLEQAFTVDTASSVTVIDPDSSANLQAKAPGLWAKLNALSHLFEHVTESGAAALDELRTEYGRVWARRLFALGAPLAVAAGVAAADLPTFAYPEDLAGDALYNLRRDAEGTPYHRAGTAKLPSPSAAVVSYLHICLLRVGATRRGAWLLLGGQSIRIVNGAGQDLRTVQSGYKEPSTLEQSEIVICAGAVNLGVPARIIPAGRGASIVRPSPGGSARWITSDDAKTEFAL
jgi:hypothetical protein